MPYMVSVRFVRRPPYECAARSCGPAVGFYLNDLARNAGSVSRRNNQQLTQQLAGDSDDVRARIRDFASDVISICRARAGFCYDGPMPRLSISRLAHIDQRVHCQSCHSITNVITKPIVTIARRIIVCLTRTAMCAPK